MERIIYIKNMKIELNLKKKYLIVSEFSELNPNIRISIKHFRLIELEEGS